MNKKRVFLIVLDSMGIGEMPDAADYGDQGSNTLAAIACDPAFHGPNLAKLGLFNIQGVTCGAPVASPQGSFARMTEASRGKDTTIGHWEIAGVISPKPLPTYPQGFPPELLTEFERRTGRKALCNKPYSGTQLLLDYGREQVETGGLLVYTSADSVFQVAAHEDVVPVEELYGCCQIARELLTGDHGVGRVIARPFLGTYPNYTRTANRHDFSLEPPAPTMLDALTQAGRDTIGVGKIYDIFAGKAISQVLRTKNNDDGMARTLEIANQNFEGLCFVNLVDFDMVYGHRNNVPGYAKAVSDFDAWLPALQSKLGEEDLLLITADHGCDPSTPSTDHSREYTPLLLWSPGLQGGTDLGVRPTFADIAATVLDWLQVENNTAGASLLPALARN